jgi:hypothetical protein
LLESFRSLRKFVGRSDTPFDERLIHHEGREGHEDRIKGRTSILKEIFFFLRALRVLRGDIHFVLVAALPRCVSYENQFSCSVLYPLAHELLCGEIRLPALLAT